MAGAADVPARVLTATCAPELSGVRRRAPGPVDGDDGGRGADPPADSRSLVPDVPHLRADVPSHHTRAVLNWLLGLGWPVPGHAEARWGRLDSRLGSPVASYDGDPALESTSTEDGTPGSPAAAPADAHPGTLATRPVTRGKPGPWAGVAGRGGVARSSPFAAGSH